MTEDRQIEIIPTCVPHDFDALQFASQTIGAFSNALHLDIDDGIFTPSISWPYSAPGVFDQGGLSKLLSDPQIEVHLMVKEPRDIGLTFARAGVSRIIGHHETMGTDAQEVLNEWKVAGAQEVGLAILFDTPSESLEPFVSLCDVVMVMSITSVGVQGLPFDTNAPAHIAQLHTRYPDLLIEVDGAVSEVNIESLVRAGATRFAVGSAIMKDNDPAQAYTRIKAAAELENRKQ